MYILEILFVKKNFFTILYNSLQFFTLDESEPLGLETLQPRTAAESNTSPLLTTSEAGEFIQIPQH